MYFIMALCILTFYEGEGLGFPIWFSGGADFLGTMNLLLSINT